MVSIWQPVRRDRTPIVTRMSETFLREDFACICSYSTFDRSGGTVRAPVNRAGGRNPTIDRRLFGIGLVGTVVATVCCVTPMLAVVLGVLGLSAWLVWTDYVIVPALGVFLVLLIIAVSRRKGGRRT